MEDVLHEGLGCCSPPSPTASALVSTPSGTGSPAKQSIPIEHFLWPLEGSECCHGAGAGETAKALVMSVNRRRTPEHRTLEKYDFARRAKLMKNTGWTKFYRMTVSDPVFQYSPHPPPLTHSRHLQVLPAQTVFLQA